MTCMEVWKQAVIEGLDLGFGSCSVLSAAYPSYVDA
jgi:hypothetical protein